MPSSTAGQVWADANCPFQPHALPPCCTAATATAPAAAPAAASAAAARSAAPGARLRPPPPQIIDDTRKYTQQMMTPDLSSTVRWLSTCWPHCNATHACNTYAGSRMPTQQRHAVSTIAVLGTRRGPTDTTTFRRARHAETVQLQLHSTHRAQRVPDEVHKCDKPDRKGLAKRPCACFMYHDSALTTRAKPLFHAPPLAYGRRLLQRIGSPPSTSVPRSREKGLSPSTV